MRSTLLFSSISIHPLERWLHLILFSSISPGSIHCVSDEPDLYGFRSDLCCQLVFLRNSKIHLELSFELSDVSERD